MSGGGSRLRRCAAAAAAASELHSGRIMPTWLLLMLMHLHAPPAPNERASPGWGDGQRMARGEVRGRLVRCGKRRLRYGLGEWYRRQGRQAVETVYMQVE